MLDLGACLLEPYGETDENYGIQKLTVADVGHPVGVTQTWQVVGMSGVKITPYVLRELKPLFLVYNELKYKVRITESSNIGKCSWQWRVIIG